MKSINTLFLNLIQRIKNAVTHSDENLQIAKDYTDAMFDGIGSYTEVSGTLVTKQWNSSQNSVLWTAPQDGIYLITMSMYPATDQQMAKNYKQFRWYGTVSPILRELTLLYWLGSTGQGLCGGQWSFPVKAQAGQYVGGYIWTDTANVTFNVRITGVLIAKSGGGNS